MTNPILLINSLDQAKLKHRHVSNDISTLNLEILNNLKLVFRNLQMAWDFAHPSIVDRLTSVAATSGSAIEQRHMEQLSALFSLPKYDQVDQLSTQLIEGYTYRQEDEILSITIVFNRLLNSTHTVSLPVNLWNITSTNPIDFDWQTTFGSWCAPRLAREISSIETELDFKTLKLLAAKHKMRLVNIG